MATLNSRTIAIIALLGACACWGLSFPLMKGLAQMQGDAYPGISSWFTSSWGLSLRFLFAGIIVGLWCRHLLKDTSRSEWSQAIGLGVFTAGGMILQMDGLNYTSASVSAFITQSYCMYIPLMIAIMVRKLPSLHVFLSAILVMAGVAVLSDLHVSEISLGRGELETLLSSFVFAILILWIDRPVYARNHMGRVSAIAFVVTGILMVPVALITMPSAAHLVLIYNTPATIGCLVMLTIICTIGGMMLMYAFQRDVGAITASITYSFEPVFACVFAFFLPNLLSMWSGIKYLNEVVTTSLLVGGALILAANIVIQLKSADVDPAISKM